MIETFNVPFITKAGFNSELVSYYCGYQTCDQGHSWGPGIRDHFLIHLVIDGRGIYKVNGFEYKLKEGQGFLIYPDVITLYQADKDTPWTYIWVGFYGIKAEEFLNRAGLNENNPIFLYDKDDLLKQCLTDMLACEENKRSRDIKRTGLLYDLIALLVENSDETKGSEDSKRGKNQYFQKAIEFIHMNYSRSISIAGIAKYIGIDRKYFHYIFKEQGGMSPQDFLISYRIERACNLMRDDTLTISHISRSVGYSDSLLFSKTFKRVKGMSPSEYRKVVYKS